MSERCLTLGCPEAIRLALQDPCTGLPICGLDNGAVVTCIRNWSIEPIVREGEASEFVADCGNVVVRDRQDDQLLGYTISFESSIRSVELEALVTGKELIPSGLNNIGTYGIASNLGCTEPSTDPRLIVEAFYKLSRCVTGADHVRVLLPMGQFKVTELDREGTITFFRYTAETSVMPAGSIGSGPFGDLPADVIAFLGGRDPEELTTGLDFEEVISISGSCGTIEVPCVEPLTATVEYDCDTDTLTITAGDGEDFSTADEISGTSNLGGFTEPITTASTTTVTVENAWAIFGEDWTLLQVCVQDVLNNDLGCVDVTDLDINCPPGDGFFIEDNLVGAGGDSYFSDVRVDSLGRSIVAATVVDPSASPLAAAIYRFTDTGEPDPTFGTGGKTLQYFGASYDDAVGVAIDPTDGGYFLYATRDISGGSIPVLARFTSAGVLDTTWGVSGVLDIPGAAVFSRAVLHAINVENTGNIVIAWNDDTSMGHVTRLDPTGALLEDVDLGTLQQVRGMHFMANGFYVVSVVEGQVTGELYASQVDLVGNSHTDTTTAPYSDLAYATTASDVVADTATDNDDAFYIAGRNNQAEQHATVARFDPNTFALDATFGTGGIATIEIAGWDASELTGIVVSQTTSDIWVIGRSVTAGVYQWIVAKLDSNGTLITTFDIDGIAELNPSGTPQAGYGLTLNSDESKVIIVGVTTTTQGYPVIGRIDSITGLLDEGFGDN